jgi:signal peptidase II
MSVLLGGIFFFIDRAFKLLISNTVLNTSGPLSIDIPFLVIGAAIVLGAFIVYFYKNYQRLHTLERVGYALIAWGGVSNIFDRVFYGGVIDYINFFGLFICNIADIMVVGGVILVLGHSFYTEFKT